MFFAIVTMLGNGENVTVATAKMEKQERVSAREIKSPKDGLFAKKMETTTFLFVCVEIYHYTNYSAVEFARVVHYVFMIPIPSDL